MSGGGGKETMIAGADPEFIDDLSGYLDVLSSSARLRILKLLEKGPKDARTLAAGIDTSYENTKKHLDRLLSIGVIRKEAGFGRETSRGVHPVWNYALVPGSLEGIVRNLGLFGNLEVTLARGGLADRLREVRARVSREVLEGAAVLVILSGPDEGKILRLEKAAVSVGRADPAGPLSTDPSPAIILPEHYQAVSRITRPHGRFTRAGEGWQFEDTGSTGGSRRNGGQVDPRKPVPIHDGDELELGQGPRAVRLLVMLPGTGTKGETPPKE